MRIVWFLVLFLVACQNAVSPAPSNVLGVLEVELGQDGAKAKFFAKAGIKTQNVLANNSFVFTVAQPVTVLDGGASGPRYIMAPFVIQNQTTTAAQNLTLYAYSQNGNSLGGTALKDIRDFGNNPITSDVAAQSVKPVHSMTADLVVNNSRADFQGFSSSEASAVQTQARAAGIIGASDTVLEYGFVARNGTARGIAGSGSGQITLALRIPRDTGNPEPYRFVMTFVVVNESTTRVSRGYGETAADAAARATSITDRTSPTQVLLIGADNETTTCGGCTVSRNANALLSSQGTTLYRPANSLTFVSETVRSNLGGVPWSINFAPDRKLYYTTRGSNRVSITDVNVGGSLRVLTANNNIKVRNTATGIGESEGGVLGMDFDPSFATTGYVYICYSYWTGTETDANRRNRLSRFTVASATNQLTNEVTLFDDMLGWSNHNGCRVVYGADGKLYFSMGDAPGIGDGAAKAQDKSSLAGKIFRINIDGSIPADNPFFNTSTGQARAVWTYGHRNPQGLVFRPGTTELWSTEHGPDKNDELNQIVAGKNYGWPTCQGVVATCSTYTDYKAATRAYEPDQTNTIAISDMVFYNSYAFPEWRGHLLFVALKTGRLYRVELNGQDFSSEQILINNTFGRLRDVTVGPDGYIYLSTDGGEIIRLRPK